MLFFVMAASIMAVCIIAIHKLARHFGRNLPLSSLVLCGISAMIINFLVISVTPFLTKTYYYVIGTMIVFAATGTTCYNKYLLYRKTKLTAVNLADEPVAAHQPQTAVPDEAPEPAADLLSQEPDNKLESLSSPEPADNTDATLSQEPTAAAKDAAPIEQAAPEPAYDLETDAEAAETVPETAAAAAPTTLELLQAMETLDDILDFAFAQTPQQPQTALQAYSFALGRYRSDEYAPFIVIDMVNLYQSQGQYLEALDCIRQAMDLPAIQDNPATRQNFQSYLSQIQALYNCKEPR